MNNKKRVFCAMGVFLGVFYLALYASSQGVLLTKIIEQYGLESGQKGYMSSAYNLGSLLSCLSAMFVMGRITKARLYALGLGVSALLLLIVGIAPPYWALVALIVLFGVALGYVDQLASSITADLFTGKTKSRMLCALHAVFGVGSILMPSTTRKLIENGLSWNRMYTLIGGAGLLVMMIFLAVGREQIKVSKESSDAHPLSRKELTDCITGNQRYRIMLSLGFYTFMLSTVSYWLCRYFELQFDNAAMGTTVLSLYWLALTISRLVTPSLPIKCVPLVKWTGFSSAALLGIGYLSHNAMLVAVCVPLSALLGGATVPFILSHLSDDVPDNTFLTTTMGLLCVYIGQTIAPTLLGVLETNLGVTACMVSGAVVSFLQGLMLIKYDH